MADDTLTGSLESTPEFASAWGEVSSQITAEGGSDLDVAAAKGVLEDSFGQLVQGMGIDGDQALAMAKDYTMKAKTVIGAVDTVSALVAAAKNASTPAEAEAAVNAIIGTVIAAATAAGAVSAGIGALIVAAVAIVWDVLNTSGLMGEPPKSVLGGIQLSFVPTIVVGNTGSTNAAVNSNGAANWRHFPVASSPWLVQHTLPTLDAFGDPVSLGDVASASIVTFEWTDSSWFALLNLYAPGGQRPIDAAFPDFALLEKGETRALPAGAGALLADFRHAFFTAWKGNQEFGFNGLKAQPDWTVLQQVATLWNRAHTADTYFDVSPGDLWDASYSGVTDMAHNLPLNDADYFIVNGKLRVYTGAQKAVVVAPPPPPNVVVIGPDADPSTNPLIRSDAVLYAGGPQLAITDPGLPAAFAALVATGIQLAKWQSLTPGQQSLVGLAGVPVVAPSGGKLSYSQAKSVTAAAAAAAPAPVAVVAQAAASSVGLKVGIAAVLAALAIRFLF